MNDLGIESSQNKGGYSFSQESKNHIDMKELEKLLGN